jgi:hypothetical protein
MTVTLGLILAVCYCRRIRDTQLYQTDNVRFSRWPPDSGPTACGPNSAVEQELRERQVLGYGLDGWNGDKGVETVPFRGFVSEKKRGLADFGECHAEVYSNIGPWQATDTTARPAVWLSPAMPWTIRTTPAELK